MAKLKLNIKVNGGFKEILLAEKRKNYDNFVIQGKIPGNRGFFSVIHAAAGKKANLNPGSIRENSTGMICPHSYWQRISGTGVVDFFTGEDHWEHLPIVFRGQKIVGSISLSFFKTNKSLGAPSNRFSG